MLHSKVAQIFELFSKPRAELDCGVLDKRNGMSEKEMG